MASFGDQLAAAKAAHSAVVALEQSARKQISTVMADWESGKLNSMSVRHRLESVIRSAYRSSAALGAALAARESGIPGWKPQAEVFSSKYLEALLKDVRANLTAYKQSEKTEADRRRAVLRMAHSAGVGAERGYTDAVIASYKELQDFGYQLRKVWVANFDGNTPCPECVRLHGQEVGLEEEFPSEQTKTKIYHTLTGPPRHPHCQCYIVVLTVSLENAFEKLELDMPPRPAPSMMSSSDVKKMPAALFAAIVKTLQKLLRTLRRKK